MTQRGASRALLLLLLLFWGVGVVTGVHLGWALNLAARCSRGKGESGTVARSGPLRSK